MKHKLVNWIFLERQITRKGWVKMLGCQFCSAMQKKVWVTADRQDRAESEYLSTGWAEWHVIMTRPQKMRDTAFSYDRRLHFNFKLMLIVSWIMANTNCTVDINCYEERLISQNAPSHQKLSARQNWRTKRWKQRSEQNSIDSSFLYKVIRQVQHTSGFPIIKAKCIANGVFPMSSDAGTMRMP